MSPVRRQLLIGIVISARSRRRPRGVALDSILSRGGKSCSIRIQAGPSNGSEEVAQRGGEENEGRKEDIYRISFTCDIEMIGHIRKLVTPDAC